MFCSRTEGLCVWWAPRSPLQLRPISPGHHCAIQHYWPGTGCHWKTRSPSNHLGNSVRRRQTWYSPEARKGDWGCASVLWCIFNVHFILPFVWFIEADTWIQHISCGLSIICFSFFFQSRSLIHTWAGASSAPKSIVYSMSAEAEKAWTDVPMACLWHSPAWNAAKSAYFPLLLEASEPYPCGNQLQTARWFHWVQDWNHKVKIGVEYSVKLPVKAYL